MKEPESKDNLQQSPPRQYETAAPNSATETVRPFSQITVSFPAPGPQNCTPGNPLTTKGTIIGDSADILDMKVDIIIGFKDGTGKPQTRLLPGNGVGLPAPGQQSGQWTCQIPNFPGQNDVNLPAMLVIRATTRDGGTVTVNVPFTHKPDIATAASSLSFDGLPTNQSGAPGSIQNQLLITGTAANTSSLSAALNGGGSVPVDFNGTQFTARPTLPAEGTNDIIFTAQDASQTQTVFHFAVKVDTTAPTTVGPSSVSSSSFDIVFSEAMAKNAFDQTNYDLLSSTGSHIQLLGSFGVNDRTVRIFFSAPSGDYTLKILCVTDQACNPLLPDHRSFPLHVS